MKQREEALHHSESRYRSLIEDQPKFVCRFKPDGSILYSNAAYASEGGFAQDDASQNSIFDLVPLEDRAQLRNHFASLGHEKPIDKIEHQFIKADGSLRWTEWINRAFFDENGEVVELHAMGRDVTARKLAEDKLHLSETQFTDAQQLSHIGSRSWDPVTDNLQWSDEHYRLRH